MSSPTLAAFLGSLMHVVCEGRFIFSLCDKGLLIFRLDDLVWSLIAKSLKEAFFDVPLSHVFLLLKLKDF